MNSERFVYCEYCDDIRQEMFDKISMMGVYRGGLTLLAPLPAVLPKLFVSTHIHTPKNKLFSTVEITLKLNDRVLQDLKIPPEQVKIGQEQAIKDPEAKSVFLQVILGLIPLEITEPGKLRVHAIIDGESFEGNALVITAPQLSEQVR